MLGAIVEAGYHNDLDWKKKSLSGPGLTNLPIHSFIHSANIYGNPQAPGTVLGAEDPLEKRAIPAIRDIRINYTRVKSAVIGKFRTVGTGVERQEWLPGGKNKMTLKIMSSGLQGKWLGR